jgi:hypothetical protein
MLTFDTLSNFCFFLRRVNIISSYITNCGALLSFEISTVQGLSELADENNTVKSSSSGNNRKNILKNPSSLDFKIRTLLIDQSRVDIKLP